jgi:hypothetical protein
MGSLGKLMRRAVVVLLLCLAAASFTVPAYARATPSQRAAQKRAKKAQKSWNRYVKQRNKAQGKPAKAPKARRHKR